MYFIHAFDLFQKINLNYFANSFQIECRFVWCHTYVIYSCFCFGSKNNAELLCQFFLIFCGKKNFVKSIRLLPLDIKSINPMRKYSKIIKSQEAWIVKIFVMILLFQITFFISDGMCSTQLSSEFLLMYTHQNLLHKSRPW